MAKFTIKEFRKQFPDEDACIHKVFTLRYAKLECCPTCNEPAAWRRIKTRKCYQCRHCYTQVYPLAGTIFEKTTTSLLDWFFVIYLFTTTRNGVAAKEIERQLGVTYKTAWRMGHQVRALMKRIGYEKMKGFVEIDETYVNTGKKDPGTRNGPNKHAPVLGMVQRMGDVVAYVMPNVTKDKVFPLINKHISKEAKVNTDEFSLYKGLSNEGFHHFTIKHALKIYRVESISTNTIEGYFSQLKRTVNTHIHVSYDYLNKYVDEVSFRYNNRKKQSEMFERLLSHLPVVRD